MTLFKQIIIPEDPSDEPIHEDLLIGHNNATLEMTGDELHVMADGDDCLAHCRHLFDYPCQHYTN
ncbi:hypothetical protein [Bifidobacterium asteroides]|uniref:hypothetical protein n=1 Tax=Bifidobacterium asteroides TaxID=1684 RepID=UPI0011B3673D|nr:hypothetical protein [Bifidobacterium asteroides]